MIQPDKYALNKYGKVKRVRLGNNKLFNTFPARTLMQQAPQTRIVNTGDQDEIQPSIDAFFKETIDHLRKTLSGNPHFQMDSHEMIASSKSTNPNTRETDNRVTYLACNSNLVAAVIEERTEFNTIEYRFWRNTGVVEKLYSNTNTGKTQKP